MTASYTGMNPEGTGSLTDHDQLWQSGTKILTTPTGSCTGAVGAADQSDHRQCGVFRNGRGDC